jgi:membrane protease YdiL (CAAX protease family)
MPAKHKNNRQARPLDTYWDRTQWPLQSLYFLLPLLILYQLGTLFYSPSGDRLLAEQLLFKAFFQVFGVASYYLPAVIVIVVLLSWHTVRRDPWRPEPTLHGMMWIESLILAAPLFIFVLVIFRQPVTASMLDIAYPLVPDGRTHSWQEEIVFSIGAGIYEELLFRLIAIALLHMLLVDLLALPDAWGAAGAVLGSALAFALYHFPPFWNWQEFRAAFQGGLFAFYLFAGVYLAAVYVLRGFGIVAATHALYDIMVVAAPFVQR